jgi:hypothetical protein
MGRTLRRLDRSISEQRDRHCCIVNRYSESLTLNLVHERTRFVRAMGPDIDIYGRAPWSGENKWEHFPNYLGSVDDKMAVMRRYTFALVFENTDHAGYVSEKILDALRAGAIPLYWGGGDFLTQCIPDDCYIDCRTVLPDDLHARLKELPFDQIRRYRKAGLGFLKSPAASRFTWRYFADAITKRFEMQRADNEER